MHTTHTHETHHTHHTTNTNTHTHVHARERSEGESTSMNSTRQVGERGSDTRSHHFHHHPDSQCSSIPSPVIFCCEECPNFYGSGSTRMRKFQVYLRRIRVVGNGPESSSRSWARIPAERFTDVVKNLMVSDKGVERKQTPAEEGQAGDVRKIALFALQGPSECAGAGGGNEQQHAPQSAGIQVSAGQASTGAVGSGPVE